MYYLSSTFLTLKINRKNPLSILGLLTRTTFIANLLTVKPCKGQSENYDRRGKYYHQPPKGQKKRQHKPKSKGRKQYSAFISSFPSDTTHRLI